MWSILVSVLDAFEAGAKTGTVDGVARSRTFTGAPLMLTDEEVVRCKAALSLVKDGDGDPRAVYLKWRLGMLGLEGAVPKELRWWNAGLTRNTMYAVGKPVPQFFSNELVRHVSKSRDPSKWYSIPLPTWYKAVGSVFKNSDMGSHLNVLTHHMRRFPIKNLVNETCWVVRASYLMGQDRLPVFEECERELVYIGLIDDRKVHFVSHKWSGNDPDKDNLVLNYVKSLIQVGKSSKKGIDEDDMVWIDYCCVPQKDQAAKNEQLRKIPFLLNYCQVHVMSDVPGYFSSIWCRIEQSINSAPGPCKDLSQFSITNVEDLDYLMLPLIQLELARMKATAFSYLEFTQQAPIFGPNTLQVPLISGRSPTYLNVNALIPNNVLLEIILFSLGV